MTVYLTYDVLTLSPNARDTPDNTLRRSLGGFDPGLGDRSIWARDKGPAVVQNITWTCQNRSEISALKAFLAARQGQAVPFWLPSRRRDLVLALPIGASDTSIVIQGMGYTKFLWPVAARHQLAFMSAGIWLLRSVTGAVDGATETLTLSSSLGVALPVDGLISQLLLCRLAVDEVELVYPADGVAEAVIPIVEVPREAP